jgi:hypothetical protein
VWPGAHVPTINVVRFSDLPDEGVRVLSDDHGHYCGELHVAARLFRALARISRETAKFAT